MSVIIRLQGLPWTASSLDIRNFFHGLSVPPGGVHIIGGSKGEAFIAFSTDEDARKAMMFNFMPLNGCVMQLFLSSKSEMQCVIEQAQNPSDQAETYSKPSLTTQTQQRSEINEFESRDRGAFRQESNSYSNYNRPEFGNTDSKNEPYPQLGRYEDQSNNGSFGRNTIFQNEQGFDTNTIPQQTPFNINPGLNNYQRDLPLRQGYTDQSNVTQMYPAVQDVPPRQELRKPSISPSRQTDQNRQYPLPPMFQDTTSRPYSEDTDVLPTYVKDVPSKEIRSQDKPDKERSSRERISRSERSDVRDSDRRSDRDRSNRDRDRDRERDRERERDRDRSRGSRNDRSDRIDRSDRNDRSDRSRGSDKPDRDKSDRDRDRSSRESDSRLTRDRSDVRRSRDNDRSDQKEPKSSSSAIMESTQNKPNYPKYDNRQEISPNNRMMPFIEDNVSGSRQDIEDFSQTGLVDPAALFSKEMQANTGPGFGQNREQSGSLPGDWRSESAHSFPTRNKDDNAMGKSYDGTIDRDPDYRQRQGGMQSTKAPSDIPWNNMPSDADFRSSQDWARRGDFDSRGRIQRENQPSDGNPPGICRPSLLGENEVSSAKGLLGDAPPGHGGVMPVSGPFADGMGLNRGGPGFGGDGPNFNRDGPNFNRDGPGFNRDGPGFNRDGPGFNRDGPGFNRDGPGFNRDSSGFNRDGPGYNRDGSGFNREATGFQREGSDPNQDASGFNRDGPGFNRDRPGFNRDRPGFNKDGGSSFNRDGPGFNRDGTGLGRDGQGFNGPDFNRNGPGFNREGSGFNNDGTGDGSVVHSDGSGFKRDGPGLHREGPGFNREGPGFNREGPGFNIEDSGFNRDGPGFNRDGPGLNRDGPGFNRDGPGFNRDGPGFNRDGRDGPAFNRDGRDGPAINRDGRDGPGFERDGSGFNRNGPALHRDGPGLSRDGPGIDRDGQNLKKDGPGFNRDGTGFPRRGSDINRDGPVPDRERPNNYRDSPSFNPGGQSTPGINRGAPLLANTPNKDGLGLMGPAPKEGLLPGLMDMDQRGTPEGRRRKEEDGRGDNISGDRKPVDRRSAGARLPSGQTPEFSQKADLDKPIPPVERKIFAQLKNLPYSATYRDIRGFFNGCEIAFDGVKLVTDDRGSKTGVGYVQFKTDADLQRALNKFGELMENRKMIILRCTQTEFENGSSAECSAPTAKRPRHDDVDVAMPTDPNANKFLIYMKGFARSTIKEDIWKFLISSRIADNGNSIFFDFDSSGILVGLAFVEFETHRDMQNALQMNGRMLGPHHIEIGPSHPDELSAMFRAHRSMREKSNPPIKRDSANEQNLKPSVEKPTKDSKSDTKSKSEIELASTCVSLKGLPSKIKEKEIIDFFSGLRIVENSIRFVCNDKGDTTGIGFVEFKNSEDCKNALKKSGGKIGHNAIKVESITKSVYSDKVKDLKNNTDKKDSKDLKDSNDTKTENPAAKSIPAGVLRQHWFYLRCKNFPETVTIGEMLKFFNGFDPIPESIRLHYSSDGKPTGNAVIGFPTKEMSESALKSLNNQMCRNSKVEIFPA